MNFQDLKKIESSDFYLDMAFKKVSKRKADLKKIRKKSSKSEDKMKGQRLVEISRLETISSSLSDYMKKILVSFPSIDSLEPFYLELVKATLDYASLKRSLGALNWADKKISSFFKIYKDKMKKSYDLKTMKKYRKEFLGRVSSVMRQMNPYLSYLEESRKEMKKYPALKTSYFTVCLFGFPNAGKSTLLSRLTPASPEINSYPFTTKSLNLGYLKEPGYNIQVIDTPGTLDRLEKMNNIELQAYLAVRYLADCLVFVFDPTYEHSRESQERLLSKLNEFRKPILVYISKSDLAKEEALLLHEKYPVAYIDPESLRKKLMEFSRNKNKEIKEII